MILYITQIEEL